MPTFTTRAVLERASCEQLLADLSKYLALPGDVYLRIKEHGTDFAVQVCAEDGDGGGDIDASHPCPGSPGCP